MPSPAGQKWPGLHSHVRPSHTSWFHESYVTLKLPSDSVKPKGHHQSLFGPSNSTTEPFTSRENGKRGM